MCCRSHGSQAPIGERNAIQDFPDKVQNHKFCIPRDGCSRVATHKSDTTCMSCAVNQSTETQVGWYGVETTTRQTHTIKPIELLVAANPFKV